MRPTVVLSDVHLSGHGDPEVVRAVAGVVGAHGGAEILFAGDTFDLSLDQDERELSSRLAAATADAGPLKRALREHLASGGAVTFMPGNHDAELLGQRSRDALLTAFDLEDPVELKVAPWFTRRGPVHIEHGHLYDPDNAPAHPLVMWAEASEPLGIALMRRFVGRTGAFPFAHAHDTTPLAGFLRAWALYKVRAPAFIARYFQTAIALCVASSDRRARYFNQERALGQQELGLFSSQIGYSELELERLLTQVPRPRHESQREIFFRLYFDRVIATMLLGLGALGAAALGSSAGLGVAMVGASYVVVSLARGGRDRYSDDAVRCLREGSQAILRSTTATQVLFGHTHIVDQAEGYMNIGSFAFTRHQGGRPYAHIDNQGTVTLRTLL